MSSERALESRTGGRAATTGVIPGDVAISVGNPGTPLPYGWEWRLLTDVARLETGHTPSRRHPEYWGGSVPWIGIRDATGNHGSTIFSTAQYTNELGIRNSSARILPAHTVCLSRTASVGYVVAMGVPMATSQDFVNWVCGPLLDYRYLKYVILAERSSFLRFASGTTHQTIYFPEVKAFHIALPPLTIQQSIAETLGVLDDRITLLRETNATLEAIAQALFKSWFVDFDPVRAKMDGRVPEGVDEATAALFPDGLEESVVGLVPTGWVAAPIYDMATFINGAAYKAFEPNAECRGRPIIKIAELKSGVTAQTAYSDVAMPGKYLIETGDILFSWSGNPDTSIDTFVWTFEPAWLNQHIFRVLPRVNQERAFVLQVLRQLKPLFTELARNKQTTGLGHVTVADMKRELIAMPTAELMRQFDLCVGPLHARIFENQKQSQTLATLRDTLLPRLISGQLQCSEVQAEHEH